MCWSSTVSLNTFLFGVFAIFIAALNGYSPFKLAFYASFVVMQLFEYFIWKHLDNKKLNHRFSMLAGYSLLLQPVAAIGLVYPQNPKLFWALLACYVVLVFLFSRKSNTYFAYEGKNGHLVWSWLTRQNINLNMVAVYMLFFFLPMLIAKEYSLFAFALVILITSLYFFWNYDSWGTMWCWFANALMLWIVIRILLPFKECKLGIKHDHTKNKT